MNTLVKMQEALEKRIIIWRRHVLSRMLERNISRDDVFNAIQDGKIIESYPQDKPYPSYLMSGFSGNKRIHVVASWDDGAQAAISLLKKSVSGRLFKNFKCKEQKKFKVVAYLDIRKSLNFL